MIAHHPGEDIIAAYAAGSLDEAQALAIATHLTLCPHCRGQLTIYETLGAALIETLPEVAMATDALAATMARVREAHSDNPITGVPTPVPTALLPAPLRRYVGGDIELAKWRSLGPGMHHLPLIDRDNMSARLVRVAPGRTTFDHGHSGSELAVVLQGSYQSGGKRFARGDLEMADESVQHCPVVGAEDACICLVVTDAPLRIDSWIGRLMRRFTGI
jgi:putative transcriptional regulator